MIVYLVHIKKYAIRKNETTKGVYPINIPRSKSEILIEVTDQFPAAFEYWSLKPDDFLNRTKVLLFKTIKAMFEHFEKADIDVGTTYLSFYKVKTKIPEETPPEGVLIYFYKNIYIYALRLD